MTTKVTTDLITSMDASKLTGSLPASMATDTSGIENDLAGIENDLAVLALHNAINSNLAAHGLTNSWIEQFEDGDSIVTTGAVRDSSEYVFSGIQMPTVWPYTNYADQVFSKFGGGAWGDLAVTNSASTTHLVAKNDASVGGYLGYAGSPSGFTTGIQFDYLTSKAWTGVDVGLRNAHAFLKTWRLEKSDNGTDWTIVDLTGATTSATSQSGQTNNNNFSLTTDATGLITSVTNVGNSPAEHGGVITFGATVTARHLRINCGSTVSNANANTAINFFIPKYNVPSVNSTGSFTSTTITPQDSASKSSLGLVILYKNASGTNALNSDIICKVSADNGSNYSTCVLESKGTFSTGINIAIAPAISVTAGTELKYKVEFANQASGSKEAQIHGVALQY